MSMNSYHLNRAGQWLGRGAGLLLALWGPAARAQEAGPAASPQAALQAYHQLDPYEKLYLHLDRGTYVSGDLLWFKVYAVEGTRHRPLPLSRVAYVEVLDQRQQPVLQAKVALQNAGGHGSFQLPATLASGQYTVRAYTSLMKNFGPDGFFHCPITVINTFVAGRQPAADSAAGYDVQFFPEGGNLVQGLRSRVAVKVTDKAGRGVAAEGAWLDRQGKIVARFTTLKYGMGRFDVVPAEAGAAYTAVTRLADQQTLTRQAPAVQAQGYVLRLDQSSPTQLVLTVEARGAGPGETLTLLGHARQRVFVTQQAALDAGQARFVLERAALPAGVLHFTVFNGRQQPVAERLYFRRPAAQLAVQPQLDRPQYGTREKVGLSLSTASATGRPAPASLSVAVYRLDKLVTTPPADIVSSLWLTSELRGEVEDPGYYLRSSDAEAEEAADNLLLTQGWRRFSWTTLLAGPPAPLRYLPELNGHFVEARVTSRAGAPLRGQAAYLAAPGRPIRLYNAQSQLDGLLRFEVKDLAGPRRLVLQADPRQDSTARLELLSPFAARSTAPPTTPGLRLASTLQPDLTQRHIEVQNQSAYFSRPNSPFARPLADSSSFYGKPDETYRLDDYTRFPVLEEVMREYVPGVQVRKRQQEFSFLVSDKANRQLFGENPMVLLDGVPVFNINKMLAVDALKIQRLDVVTGLYVHGPLTYSGLVSYTSYKGDLAGLTLGPSALVQDYEGLQWEREFYAPRYETAQQQQSRLLDRRNLLYWNPDVTTAAGAQKLDFFTSDQAGTYLLVVQGLSTDGLAGSSTLTFEVKPRALAQGK